MNDSIYRKYGVWMVLLVVISLPAIAWGVRGAMRRTTHDVRRWVPDRLEEARTYQWFLDHFGADEVAVVSWPGCMLDDPRLDDFADSS